MPKNTCYRLEGIVDVTGPGFAARYYIEQSDVRIILAECSRETRIDSAGEIGCGYGRMTMVLPEFAGQVHGFERERSFVGIARALIPGITFFNVESLSDTGAKDSSYDFILTFTVLQHISDPEVARVTGEIKRISRPGGYVLLCEETDATLRTNTDNSDGFFTIGRSADQYASLMHPLRLVKTRPRRIGPGYGRENVGRI